VIFYWIIGLVVQNTAFNNITVVLGWAFLILLWIFWFGFGYVLFRFVFLLFG
jgi:hypothetical protein